MEQAGGNVSEDYSSNCSEEELTDVRRGPWTVEEDFTLINYIAHHGEGRWNSLARSAGLKRTGKSCRLRWLNYLRPDVRRGNITLEEQLLILELHSRWGNRWSKIAQHLPGRTDNEIKNYWRTRVQKHAKQLKCDVNSKQFKDTMRYLWMPRLVERIQAAAANSSSATTYHHNTHNFDNMVAPPHQQPQPNNMSGDVLPDNSSAAASSDSFGTTTECYNNYAINQNPEINYPAANQNTSICYGGDHQSLTSPTDYFNQGLDFIEHNSHTHSHSQSQSQSQWMDASDNLWNVDDMWFLHHQFNNNV